MPRPVSEEARKQWEEHIQKQRDSGFSISSWCQQNKINVHSFRYWRNKFTPKASLSRFDFEEISNQELLSPTSKDAGIFLKYQGFTIHMEKQFDLGSLQQCLRALKEVLC